MKISNKKMIPWQDSLKQYTLKAIVLMQEQLNLVKKI